MKTEREREGERELELGFEIDWTCEIVKCINL